MLRLPRYRLSWAHLNKYKETVPPSEPVEDFEDRIALYSLYVQPEVLLQLATTLD